MVSEFVGSSMAASDRASACTASIARRDGTLFLAASTLRMAGASCGV